MNILDKYSTKKFVLTSSMLVSGIITFLVILGRIILDSASSGSYYGSSSYSSMLSLARSLGSMATFLQVFFYVLLVVSIILAVLGLYYFLVKDRKQYFMLGYGIAWSIQGLLLLLSMSGVNALCQLFRYASTTVRSGLSSSLFSNSASMYRLAQSKYGAMESALNHIQTYTYLCIAIFIASIVCMLIAKKTIRTSTRVFDFDESAIHYYGPQGNTQSQNKFDPYTGKPVAAKTEMKFDPYTGKPITQSNTNKFDPYTGKPVNETNDEVILDAQESAQEVVVQDDIVESTDRFDSMTGEPVVHEETQVTVDEYVEPTNDVDTSVDDRVETFDFEETTTPQDESVEEEVPMEKEAEPTRKFDPYTGEPISTSDTSPKFDPYTGEPINQTRVERNAQNYQAQSGTPFLKTKNGLITIVVICLLVAGTVGYNVYNAFFNKTKIDLASNITLNFSGYSGNGYVSGRPTNNVEYDRTDSQIASFVNSVSYSYSKSTGLKNGDTVTVTVTYNHEVADALKLKVTKDSKDVTVSGLIERYTSASAIPNDIVTRIKSDAENKIKSITTNSSQGLNGTIKYTNTFQNLYFLRNNSTYTYSSDSVAAVYKVDCVYPNANNQKRTYLVYVYCSGVNSNYTKTTRYWSYNYLRDSSYNYLTDTTQIKARLASVYSNYIIDEIN